MPAKGFLDSGRGPEAVASKTESGIAPSVSSKKDLIVCSIIKRGIYPFESIIDTTSLTILSHREKLEVPFVGLMASMVKMALFCHKDTDNTQLTLQSRNAESAFRFHKPLPGSEWKRPSTGYR